MVKEVIKKDGTKEPFEAGKIKRAIAAAAAATNLSEERKNEIVQQVAAIVIQTLENKDEVTTNEIKESVLAELDRLEPSIASAWRKYDEEKSK